MKPSKLQTRALQSEDPITIIADAKGCGGTTAMLLKAIYTADAEVSFYAPNLPSVKEACDSFTNLLKELEYSWRYSHQSRIFTFTDVNNRTKKVKFMTPESEDELRVDGFWKKRLAGLILVDLVDRCPRYFTDYLLDRVRLQDFNLMVSTTPYDCAWRNPKLEKGIPVFDDNQCMIWEKSSWDSQLINWGCTTDTRAGVDSYITGVEVITGYGFNDDLLKNSPNYWEVVRTLNPKDKKIVMGQWFGGVSL